MKKNLKKSLLFLTVILTISIILILQVAQISALEIKTEKTEFNQAETFMATLQGNLLTPIEKQNVGFYEAHVQLPLTFDMIKIRDTYYIYAILPYSEKNLTLKIKDVYFKEQNQPKKQDLEKNFTITNTFADFNVEPAVFLTKLNLSLKLYNNLDTNQIISYTIDDLTRTINLPLQKSSQLKINIADFPSQTLSFLELKSDTGFSYQIPIYSLAESQESETPTQAIQTNQTNQTNQTIQTENFEKLSFPILEINETMNKADKITRTIQLANIGDLNSENIQLIVSSEIEKFITLSTTQIDLIESNQTIEFEFTADFNQTGTFSGFILAESENSFDAININFNIGENLTPSTTTSSKKTCAEIGGKQCLVCDGESKFASDGICCLGTCKEDIPDKPKKRNWIAIIVILVALAIIGAVVYIKFKKPKLTAEDILEKRKKSFSNKYKLEKPEGLPKELSSKELDEFNEDSEEV